MEEIMKKLLALSLMLILAIAIWAQGLETFDNFDYTSTNYIDGNFTGENGVVWNYYHVTGATAGANSNPIEGNGMILRRSAVPSRIVSNPIPNGIGNFSVEMRKAYTSVGDRQVALYINDNWFADSEVFGSTSGADETVHIFEVNGVNVPGDFTLEIRHIQGNDQNRQLTIDNITWTAYGSGMQFVANPVFNPPAGHYPSLINVAISTTTEGAAIYYTLDGSEPSQNSTLYSTPIPISSPTALKARGYKEGFEPSAIQTAQYGFYVNVMDLAELRSQAADNNTVYHIPGEVILSFKQSNRNQKYVEDGSAGILIDDTGHAITTDYEIGDGISGLTGKLNPYFETLQFLPTVDPGAATSHGNDLEIPVLTISELTADIGINQYQSRMVQINNVSIDDASGNYTTNPAENYTISDPTGSMTFRTTFFNVDYIDTPMHTGVITMRGIIAHFQDTVQITPRMLADFNPLANEELVASPSGISLKGNYPNPFNPHTTIEFNMEKAAPAQIEIYNQKGQIIKTIDVVNAHKGINTLSWNGTDNSGRGVSSGVYYFRLKSGSYSSTKKMVLMK